MTKIILFCTLLLCASEGYAQKEGLKILSVPEPVLYANGGTIKITSGTVVKINGDIQVQSGSTLTNDGEFAITGDLINNLSMSAANLGKLTFEGASIQTLSGSETFVARDVTVNNASGLILSTPLKVDGTMTFTSGIVSPSSSSSALVFTANGAAGTVSDASHVNGYVIKEGTGSFSYPVGDGSKYQPVSVNLTANTTGLSAIYTASDAGTASFGTTGASVVALSNYNNQEYWDLSPVGAGEAEGKVTISWDAYKNPSITSSTNINVFKVGHKRGLGWLNEGSSSVSGTVSAGSVTSATVSSWSPFTLGSIPESALPVRLTSFTAKRIEDRSQLRWKIADAVNFDHFEIERSTDGKDFKAIGKVVFEGVSYEFIDADFYYAPINYYRLKLVDQDGSFAYSKIESVRFDKSMLHGYPNPFVNALTIVSGGKQRGHVVDLNGRVVTILQLKSGENTINVSNWASGNYLVYTDNGEVIRLVKQ